MSYNVSIDDRNHMVGASNVGNIVAGQSHASNCKGSNGMSDSKATLTDTHRDHHKSFPDVRANNANRSSKCNVPIVPLLCSCSLHVLLA